MNIKGTKKKNQVATANIFEQQELLKKAEVIRKNLTASTWHELETNGKFCKNEKLSFIRDDMLILGCDVGSETHYIRAIDTRGRELSKSAFSFNNDSEGFQRAKEWAVKIASEHNKNQIVPGLEPTGHYWFCLATWMVSNGISVVQVNPYAVKQTKEIPADKVTDEMLRDIIDKTQDAVENGDESMKGDAGKDVLEKLGENVGNSPNASDKTKEEAGAIKGDANTDSKESEEAKKEDGKKDNANTGDSGNKQTANNNTPNNSASNNTGNNASKPTGGNTQNNKPSKPAHQHSWKDHAATKTEWIPNIVTVDDYAKQQVQVGTAWQCNCGTQILGNAEEHIMNHILNGEPDNGRSVPIYETQTVKVGSHTEDRGSYQTTSYVDYQYCDCGAKR